MTMHHAGRLLAATRKRLRVTPQSLAGEIGWRNLNKGARRILALERGETVDRPLYGRLVELLGISAEAVAEAERLDAARALELRRTPVEPEVVVRLTAAVWKRCPIPEDARNGKALVDFGVSTARHYHNVVCLRLPNRTTLWIDRHGEIYHRSEPDQLGRASTPSVSIGGRRLGSPMSSSSD